MSGFLDKLTANVTNVSRIGIQKAKNMSEASSLGSEQKSEKKNIQNQYAEIGRLYYEKYKNDPDAEFPEQIASILASEKRITELDAEIAAVRAREPELVEVPVTPAKPAQPAAPHTGTPTSMVCMQCGSTYNTDKTQCDVCHTPLVPQYGGSPAVRTEPNSTRPDTPQDADPQKPDTLDFLVEDAGENTNAPDSSAAENKPEAADVPETSEKTGCFCPYCGKPAEKNAKFCAFCGKSL